MLAIDVATTAIEAAVTFFKPEDNNMITVLYTGVEGDGFYCLAYDFEAGDWIWIFVDSMGEDATILQDEQPSQAHKDIADAIIDMHQ